MTATETYSEMQLPHYRPVPWAEFRAELLTLYTPPVVAPMTRGRLVQVLRELEALGGIETTADLTVQRVAQYVASRPPNQSAYTLHGVLSVVRTICTYAETAGYLRINPFRLRKLSKWVRLPALSGKRHLSRDEIRRILDVARTHVDERTGWSQWRARRTLIVIAIIAYTGVRKNECLYMRVTDVDLPNRILWVRGHGRRLKTSASEQPIPMPAALVPFIEDWLCHRLDGPVGWDIPADCPYLVPTLSRKAPWVSGSPGGKALDRLRAVAKLAGIEKATFQMLRASWATHAELNGMGEAMISRVLRHTTTSITKKHYRKADLANMAQAVEGFDFG
jgi:integrase